MAVQVPRHDGRDARLDALEVLAAAVEMAGVARSVAGPTPEVPAPRTQAVDVDVRRDARHEGREPALVRYALPQRLRIGWIGMADGPLSGVQLVGAGLALVEGEPGVMVRPVGSVGLGQGRAPNGRKLRPMYLPRGRTDRAPAGS